jgi:hypothetical protein
VGGSIVRTCYGEEEAFSILVREYEGVFFIEPFDDETIEYFSSLEDALHCIKLNWLGAVKAS